MSTYPAWQYDEMKQVGKDYDDPAEVEAYDVRHGKFRNVEKENEAILQALQIEPRHVLIEIGAGTGSFAIQAARACSRVYAVDISQAMLAYAKKKAERAAVTNLVFRHAGFLTYVHDDQPVDAIVTNTAFHHLPDFWKGLALHRLNRMLKPGGLLYLSDVVFDDRNVCDAIQRFIGKLGTAAGPEIRKDIENHVRNEYSTYGWIMEGLFERAGFAIAEKAILDGVIGRYLCRKRTESSEGFSGPQNPLDKLWEISYYLLI